MTYQPAWEPTERDYREALGRLQRVQLYLERRGRLGLYESWSPLDVLELAMRDVTDAQYAAAAAAFERARCLSWREPKPETIWERLRNKTRWIERWA